MQFIPWAELSPEQKDVVRERWEGCDAPGVSCAGDYEYAFGETGDVMRQLVETEAAAGNVIKRVEQVLSVPRSVLRPSLLQVRKRFEEQALSELGLSIRNNGLVNALLVRPCEPTEQYPEARYELVAGECRWRSTAERPHPTAAGEMMPAVSHLDVIVRELPDNVVLELMLAENLQRKELTPLEEMDAFGRMMDQRDKAGKAIYTAGSLGEKVGVSATYVIERLSLRKLTKLGREALERAEINFKTARVICRCPESIVPQVEDEVLNPAKYGNYGAWFDEDRKTLNADEALEVIHDKYMRDLRGSPFELKDANLVPAHLNERGERIDGGACSDCPWNSANQGDAKQSGGELQRCLNPTCYQKKVEVHIASAMTRAKESGARVLTSEETSAVMWETGELKHGADYVDIDKKVSYSDLASSEEADKAPKWKKVLGKAVDESAIVVAIDKAGNVHNLVPRAVAIEAARQNGKEGLLSVTARGHSVQEADAQSKEDEKKAKRKLQHKFLEALIAALVGKVEQNEWSQPATLDSFFQALAPAVGMHVNLSAALWLCKRRDIEYKKDDVRGTVARALLESEGAKQLGIIIELLFGECFSQMCSEWYNGPEIPDEILPLLKFYGVDAEALKTEVASREAANGAKGKKGKGKAGDAPAAEAVVPVPETVGNAELPLNDVQEPTPEGGPEPVQSARVGILGEFDMDPRTKPEDFEWGTSGNCINPIEISLEEFDEVWLFLAAIPGGWTWGYKAVWGGKSVERELDCLEFPLPTREHCLVAGLIAIQGFFDLIQVSDREKKIIETYVHEVSDSMPRGYIGQAPDQKEGDEENESESLINPELPDSYTLSVRDRVLAALKEAGEEGLTVKEISEVLQVKYKDVYIWLVGIGKPKGLVEKIGPARYRLNPGALENLEPAEQMETKPAKTSRKKSTAKKSSKTTSKKKGAKK